MAIKQDPALRARGFTRIEKPLIGLLVILLLILVYRSLKIRFGAAPAGDETFYIHEVQRLQDKGPGETLRQGVSFLYVVLGNAIGKITGNILLANRLVSLLSLAFVIHALHGIAALMKVSRNLRGLMILTLLAFAFDHQRSPFLFGLNDPLLFALMAESLFFTVRYLYSEKNRDLLIASVMLGAGFWVREITLIYVVALAIATGFYSIQLLRKKAYRKVWVPVLFFAVAAAMAILPHLPALASRGTLGFEDKNYMGNWRERDYLSQVRRISTGSLFAYKRVEWEEVEAYKADPVNPPLPATRIEIFRRDPKMVMDSFASNLLIRNTFFFLFRNGILFLMFLYTFRAIKRVKDMRQVHAWWLLAFIVITYTLFISAITLHNIDIRWMALTIMLMAVAGVPGLDLLRRRSQQAYRWFLYLQYAFIAFAIVRLLIP